MEEKKENPEELGIKKGNESEESNEQEKEETPGPSKRKLSRSSDEEDYERGRKRIKSSVKGEPVRDLGRKRCRSAEDGEQGVRKKIKTSSLGNPCLQTDRKEEQSHQKNDQVSSSRKSGQKRSRESDDEDEQGKKKIAKVSYSKTTNCQREEKSSRKEEQDKHKTGETSSPKKCVRKRSRTSDEEEKEEEQGRQKRKKITSSEKSDENNKKINKSVTQDTPKSGPISSSIKSAKKRCRESDEEERDKQKMPKISLDKPLSDHYKKHRVNECIAGTSWQIAVNEMVHFSQSITGYHIHKVLGEGSYGKVMLASHTSTNQLVAIKMIKKKAGKTVPVQVEERILQIARGCPFLCHGLTSFHSMTFSFLVMEFIQGGTLDSFAAESESLSITAFSFIAAELVCGIQFLHSKGIIHRDLKFQNIMLDHEGHVKITDFGLAAENIFGSNKASGRIGTIRYMAPEVLAGKAYGASVDWWSFGVVIFIMVTRQHPFDIRLRGSLYQEQVRNTEPSYPDSLDKDFEDILKKLLDKDPDSRLGVSGNIREHPFFKDIDWEEVELRKVRPPFQPFKASSQSS